MTKISVIIPVYNAENYLKKCIDSVINQTLTDIEIICINDGSTDNSLKILEEYALQDNRIKIINQENQGAGAARNAGIKVSSGTYIGFIDPDDFYPSKDVLNILYTNATEHDVLVCGGSVIFYKDNEFFESRYEKGVFKTAGYINFNDYQFDYYYQRFIYNTEFLKKNNLYFPLYRRYQDAPFFLNVMEKCKQFYAIPDLTYVYFESENGNTSDSKKVYDMLNGIAYCLDLSKKNKWNYVHYQIAQRLNGNYYKNIFKRQIKKIYLPVILQLYITLNKIDMNVIKKINNDFCFNHFISFFRLKNLIRNFSRFSIKKYNDKYLIYLFGIKISIKRSYTND